ncbi:hypothetical protein TNCV_2266221 [Trichonephila clavipes]|nr:hypothetical protein TNCV_2266221 [Trichonephila clavipes]
MGRLVWHATAKRLPTPVAQQPRVGLGLLKKPFPGQTSSFQFSPLSSSQNWEIFFWVINPSKIWPALSLSAISLSIEDFLSDAVFAHSDNETCPFNSLYFDEVNNVTLLYD